MGTNNLEISIAQSPAEAPKYGKDFTAVNIDKAIIVKKGTVNGNPTVDLQFTDANGNKFIAMATGAIIESLAGAIRGVKHN